MVNFVDGYTTSEGLLLDLDRTTFEEALKIAKRLMKQYSLEGYLLLESSELSHHIIFNKKLKWKKVLEILFKLVWRFHYYEHQKHPSLTNWAILQVCKQSCTLRIGGKRKKGIPKLLLMVGLLDKICREYVELRKIICPI